MPLLNGCSACVSVLTREVSPSRPAPSLCPCPLPPTCLQPRHRLHVRCVDTHVMGIQKQTHFLNHAKKKGRQVECFLHDHMEFIFSRGSVGSLSPFPFSQAISVQQHGSLCVTTLWPVTELVILLWLMFISPPTPYLRNHFFSLATRGCLIIMIIGEPPRI